MSDEEFWGLALPEFLALLDRRREELRLSHAPAALICSVMAEMKRDPAKRAEPFSASDFMPSGKPAKLPEPQTAEQMAARVRMLASALGGTLE